LLSPPDDLLAVLAKQTNSVFLDEVASGRKRARDLRGMRPVVRQADTISDAFVTNRLWTMGSNEIVNALRNAHWTPYKKRLASKSEQGKPNMVAKLKKSKRIARRPDARETSVTIQGIKCRRGEKMLAGDPYRLVNVNTRVHRPFCPPL
jgi:hypothetical protein